MPKPKIDTRTAPSAWAAYFMNDAASSLSDDEQDRADAWRRSLGIGRIVGCEDAGFIVNHDARQFALPADCQRYTFLDFAD